MTVTVESLLRTRLAEALMECAFLGSVYQVRRSDVSRMPCQHAECAHTIQSVQTPVRTGKPPEFCLIRPSAGSVYGKIVGHLDVQFRSDIKCKPADIMSLRENEHQPIVIMVYQAYHGMEGDRSRIRVIRPPYATSKLGHLVSTPLAKDSVFGVRPINYSKCEQLIDLYYSLDAIQREAV